MHASRNALFWNISFGSLVRPLLVAVLVMGTTRGAPWEFGRSRPELSVEDKCPSCDALFTALEDTVDGKRVQHIEVQERGEPKSGTTFMFQWARGVLHCTCDYLKTLYGKDTCRVQEEGPLGYYKAPKVVVLTFEPHFAGDDAMCRCDGVDKVRISVNETYKHMLPVNSDCRWKHSSNIQVKGHVCTSVKQRPVRDFQGLWSCMAEANCTVTDKRRQFVLMRDPRAIAVSLYYHMQVHPSKIYGINPPSERPVDEGVLELLPEACKWLAIRHILFEGLLPAINSIFWYQDSKDNPLTWHYRWAALAGLQLPSTLVESMASWAITGNFSFEVAGYNEHPGGEQAVNERTWRDEISPNALREMDIILNTWLPPVILARLGVAPELK